ncbi:MAG: hypothetical protein LBU62_03445 [Bacteroidales bacterium]|jgi:hypothetical protein|nr:hypothetical protein [Bacteroidales bacterium]
MEMIKEKGLNPDVVKMQNDLLRLMLKKAGIRYDDLVTSSIKSWVGQNLDLLTESEVQKYKNVII